ncbi:MobF family relaxase [Nonomuraea sp. NEAU-A123]|uniref:MobF family relaxase n=1 Tax=Nonomuraea sp. NEAU-A123 TaxID=2839649 RepID=UPI001BE49515|nr:MobF family relaxase [Nonomuraea sp. NEAU-A123]MBT2234431.1 relaxase domain-containing protein [Nonomuraea sp. NEAU-A123]
MAWVNVLGPCMEQVEYRLQEGAGCGVPHAGEHGHEHHEEPDGQLSYRLGGESALVWIGEGLREVGITPGTRLTPDQHGKARALMNGEDPNTGKLLMKAKHVVDPRGKLPAAPFGEALEKAAAARGTTVEALLAARPAMVKRAAQMARGIARKGEAHLVRISDLDRLAFAAGLDLADVYEPEELAYARKWRDARVRIGNRGYDLTLDVTKSVSVLIGLAGPSFAAELEDIVSAAMFETVAAVEQWVSYGQRGHQGDGQLAGQMATTGSMGWVMWHRTARPVGSAAPDPHLHAHIVIANLARGRDGKWSAIASGGRDLHRHARAADAFFKARHRRGMTERCGIAWTRDPETGAWEIAAIPVVARTLFSKRDGQVKQVLAKLGFAAGEASRQVRKVASTQSRQRKTDATKADLRADWRNQLEAAGMDATALVAACRTGAQLPVRPSPAEIAAWIWRPEGGLTSHRKEITRADVLAAVLDALPDGVANLAEAETLTDQVLELAPAVRLPDAGARHLANSARYTSTDILRAEQALLASVRRRYATGVAVLDADAVRLALDTFQVSHHLTFTGEQRAVLERILCAGHGVEAIIGVPGAGKTTLMAAARTAYESRGLVVQGAATAAVAAATLRAESGIGTDTIATWLLRIQHGPGLAGVDVLVVDEAAMVDDRQLAALLDDAERHGTKVVLLGDPKQLRAVGVGGGFAAIHRQVDGLALRHNRRQRDPLERKALELFRAGQRRQALHTWAAGGRVRTEAGADDTMARLIADWAATRRPYLTNGGPQTHDELAGLLVLAGTNEAVNRLNLAARAIRRELCELSGPDRIYRLAGGASIALAVGDHVRVRKNDYRARRGEGPVDVLNGYRGCITALDHRHGVQVEWRRTGPDGAALVREWVSPAYIAVGGLSYGTVMTVAAAQGLNSQHTLIYGLGLDPHTLYTAMSRDRQSAHLYLPRELLENDADRLRHGPTRGPADELQRALAAYATTLYGDRADHLLTPEPEPIAHQLDPTPPSRAGQTQDAELEAARAELQAAAREAHLAVERARVLQSLTNSPSGVELASDAELSQRMGQLGQHLSTTTTNADAAEKIIQRLVTEGGGHRERRLLTERANLEEQAHQIETAETAALRLQQARQAVNESRQRLAKLRRQERTIERELASLRPWQRAHRRDLTATFTDLHRQQDRLTQQLTPILAQGPALEDAARQTAAQAPPPYAWPQVRQRHAELKRTFDSALRAARERDVALAQMRAHEHRKAHAAAQQELTAIQSEIMRRIDLPPDQRDLEQLIRAEHVTSWRADARQKTGQYTHRGIDQHDPSQAYQPPHHRSGTEPHRGEGLSR